MKFTIIFSPLNDKKSLKAFFISSIIITIIYFSFSIALTLFLTIPFPKGRLTDIILFGWLKAFSTFIAIDWIVLALFPIVGGLLFANYSYWKCKTNKIANTGLGIGLLAAICPACLLPIIGISSFIPFLTKIGIYIKIGTLLVLIGATYYVANRQTKCLLNKKEANSAKKISKK